MIFVIERDNRNNILKINALFNNLLVKSFENYGLSNKFLTKNYFLFKLAANI